MVRYNVRTLNAHTGSLSRVGTLVRYTRTRAHGRERERRTVCKKILLFYSPYMIIFEKM